MRIVVVGDGKVGHTLVKNCQERTRCRNNDSRQR